MTSEAILIESTLNIAPCIPETIKLTKKGNRNELLSVASRLIKKENKQQLESDPSLLNQAIKDLNENFNDSLSELEVESIVNSTLKKDYRAGCKLFQKSCKGFRNCIYSYSDRPNIGFRKRTGLEILGNDLHETRSKSEDIAWKMTDFHHIIRDAKTHELCIYQPDSGHYLSYNDTEFASFLANELDNYTLNESKVRDVFKSFRFTALPSKEWISFNNYIVNTNDLNFLEYSQHHFIRSHIPFDYQKDLEERHHNTFVEQRLKEILPNPDDFNAYIEMLGYILGNQGNPRQVLFLFHGPGNSGKSTLLNLISRIFESTCSYVSIEDIAKNDANVASIIGKRVNIASDISDKAITDTSSLKRAVGGDGLTINVKYSQPVSLEPEEVPVTLASCNKVPQMGKDEIDKAMLRRIILIHAPNNFEGIANPDLLNDMWNDKSGMEWLLKQSLVTNMVHEGDGASSFSTHHKLEEMQEIYKRLSNPMANAIDALFESTNISEYIIPGKEVIEEIKLYYSEHPDLGKFNIRNLRPEMENIGAVKGRHIDEKGHNIQIYRFVKLKNEETESNVNDQLFFNTRKIPS